jgi:hypothetical protein
MVILELGMSLTSCKDDVVELEPVDPTPADSIRSHLHIMTVFAPGQLGDNGYCDRVLTSAFQLKDSVGSNEALDVEFIAKNSLESTYAEMQAWAKDTINPIYHYPYVRRLLVLTEPYMIPWLREVKDYLRSTDEVLVLKAADDDTRPADESLHLGSRLHAMSISLSGPTHSFMWYLRDFLEVREYKTAIVRLFNETNVHYRDSIYETLIEEGMPEDSIIHVSLADSPDKLYNTLSMMKASLTDMAYKKTQELKEEYNSRSLQEMPFCIADLGSANPGYRSLFESLSNPKAEYKLVLVNAEIIDGGAFDFLCKYNVALSQWCTSWLRQPPSTMPAMVWHGFWDDYSESILDLYRSFNE